MSTPTQRHLVTVWNPAYAHDAMAEHLRVLLDMTASWRRGELEPDDVYVWWGKVRSRNRAAGQALAHEQDLRELRDELARREAGEVHLYLTDYRSLYVGHVQEISYDDARLEDPDRVPAYYDELACDCWFRLGDIRRLVDDDLDETIAELKLLHNVHYDDRPVSIYGGMVNLPLVVRRPDAERFFDDAARRGAGHLLWAEADAERGGMGEMQRELRHNLFGDEAWEGLHRDARLLLADAETFHRSRRGDAGANFAPAIVGYAAAIEAQCRALLDAVLEGIPPASRRVNVAGQTVDLARDATLTLGQLAHAIRHEAGLKGALHTSLTWGGWFVGDFMTLLAEFADVRNSAAHGARVDRDLATRWRERLLGIGCEGAIPKLGRVRRIER